MKISPLGYYIADLIRDLLPFSPKFLINDLLSSASFSELNKVRVVNLLLTETGPDEGPLPDNMRHKILAAVTYDEPVQLSLIHNLLIFNFGLEPTDTNPFIIIEGDIYDDKTDVRITAQTNGTVDLTNFRLLKKMKKEGQRFVPDTDGSLLFPITSQQLIFELNSLSEFNIKREADYFNIDFPPCQIGDTGFIFELEQLGFKGKFPDFSLAVENASIYPPENLALPGGIPFPKILIQDGALSKDGISGKFSAEWDLRYNAAIDPVTNNPFSYSIQDTLHPATIFGTGTHALKGGISHITLQFEKNQLVNGSAHGKILVPYFNQAIDIHIKFITAADFSIVLTSLSAEGFELNKESLLKLNVQMLGLEQKDGRSTFSITGGLEPQLYAAEGMKWPRMDVKNLRIDSTGKFSIEEAWLDLKDMATLDLFGFHLELRKIGIGTVQEEGNDKLWVDLSGGLKLVEQIPVGIDVEGFRIIWPQSLSLPNPVTPAGLREMAEQTGIQFKGVQFSFGVPNALKIDGLIRFFKNAEATGFAGDMVLAIPPAGITAEAGLMVGMNTEPDPYAFFYVYFGLECTAGIPLGQSGLALKGALGLFGINVTPDKTPEQNWYFDWYKRAPGNGAHQTTKWTYQRDSLAVGAGVTITTVDGVVKGTKGIVVLALPGPILVINGKALVLNGLNPGEPPFTATAVFDGREKIVQFNIEAQAELVKDTLDAYAGVEAFFDFKDITNWHLYLGQDFPRSRRVRANLLNIIEADAYLMLDMVDADSLRARMGALVSAKPKIDSICFDIPLVGRKCIRFDAHLDIGGDGEISLQPEQFSATGFIDAGIAVSALGISIEVGAYASVEVEGPSPFSLQADLKLYADLPEPLPDYEDNFKYKLTIPEIDLNITNPLVTVSMFSRFTPESKPTPLHDCQPANSLFNNPAQELSFLQNQANNIPTVNCDINPLLSFEHEMNQDCNFIMHPGNIKKYDTGILRFTPTLRKIIIQEKKKDKLQADWTTLYSTEAGIENLSGVWLAENDPGSPEKPASRRLQLLTSNPLINTMHYPGPMGFVLMQTEADTTHLSRRIVEDYPDLMTCSISQPAPICTDFNYTGKAITGKLLTWAGIQYRHSVQIEIKDGCLTAPPGLALLFTAPLKRIELTFCKKPEKISIKTFAYPSTATILKMHEDARKAGKPAPSVQCDIPVTVTFEIKGNSYIVTAAKGFDCLEIAVGNKERIQLKKVCYITQKAAADYSNNKLICNRNATLFTPPPVAGDRLANPVTANNLFTPGSYYKIMVESVTTGEIGIIKEDFITNLYTTALGDITKSFTSCCYFQTASPPEHIAPYIKWSAPHHQFAKQFVTDPLFIRFKREYLRAFFSNKNLEDYQLAVFIKDSNGIIAACSADWSRDAGSYTLFPDEETWQQHLLANNINIPVKKDNLLKIIAPAGNAASMYKTNGRYELLLCAKEPRVTNAAEATAWNKNAEKEVKGQPIVRPVVKSEGGGYYTILSATSFTTSKFSSFGASIPADAKPAAAGVHPIIVKGGSRQFDTGLHARKVNTWAAMAIQHYINTVNDDYGLAKHTDGGILLLGKEAVDKTRLLVREAKDGVDDQFRNLAISINQELLFKTPLTSIELTAVDANRVSNAAPLIKYLWLHLPETIELLIKTSSAVRNFGQTDLRLLKLNTDNTKMLVAAAFIFNTDCSQVIVQPVQSIRSGTVKQVYFLEFTIIKDFKDDLSDTIFGNIPNKHHRFDRPSIKGAADEKILFKFLL